MRRVSSAEGARIEAPKALSGVGSGKGCPLPSRLGVWGSVASSPSGVRGGAPAANAFCHILGQENIFLDRKMHFRSMCLCPRGTVFRTVNYITASL